MIKYQKEILDNGLTVIIEQDKSTTLAAVNVLYRVGSRNEDPSKTGVAHLFEHLMFEGSTNAPDFDSPLQMAGGENNAFTNNDYTNYYELVPAYNIETALWLEADRMSQLSINQQSLDLQKKVVIEEFKEVCLNKPYGDNWHHLSALAYERHPYRWPTIGLDISHIESTSLDDIRSFYDRYYNPANAIITISGPLPHNEVLAMVKKWFGNIKGNPINSYDIPQEDIQGQVRHKKVEGKVPAPMLLIGCHMPGRTHEDYYACDLLTDILSNGKSSRLHKSLVREKKIFTSVDCYISGSVDPGLILIEGKPHQRISIQDSLSHIWDELDQITSAPPSIRELQKVKNKVLSSIAMHDISILNKAASLAYFEHINMLDQMNQQEVLYNQVTIEDIIRVSQLYLQKKNASIIEYVPQAA